MKEDVDIGNGYFKQISIFQTEDISTNKSKRREKRKRKMNKPKKSKKPRDAVVQLKMFD